ncbi:MAG: IS66 family insertion sequence element accessory protein TnpA [Clostridium sp.]
MHKKLNNQEWCEQIEEYYNNHTSITINKFCEDNNLSKQQFHYHKKKRVSSVATNNTIFQAVPIMPTKKPEKPKFDIEKIKISVGNATITVFSSETAVVSVVVDKQVDQC